MIPIRKIKVKSEKRAKELLSTLNWHTHHVKDVWFAKTNTFSTTTARPFVGKIDEEKARFILTRKRSQIESWAPQLIVKGEITEDIQTVFVLIFLPGLLPSLVFILLLVFTGYWIWKEYTTHVNTELMKNIIMPVFVIMGIIGVLTFLEFDKTKNELFKILELKSKK